MTPEAKEPTVDQYIAAQPISNRPVLQRVRAAIRKALPRAVEEISYRIPVYKVDGRMVLYFAGFREHYSIYPATRRVVAALEDKADALLHNRATLRFSYADPVPARLIARIARVRAAEAAEGTTARAARTTAKARKPAAKGRAAGTRRPRA